MKVFHWNLIILKSWLKKKKKKYKIWKKCVLVFGYWNGKVGQLSRVYVNFEQQKEVVDKWSFGRKKV
jgi:hypothetical protein